MRPITVIAVVALLTMTSGCATVFRGTDDNLRVQSTPTGAKIETSTGLYCAKTPCSFLVQRNSNMLVTATLPGCEPKTVNVTNKFASNSAKYIVLDVLGGGILAGGIDYMTGAFQEVYPNPLIVPLDC